MIDQRINSSLKELEQSLKDIDSARKQVETTVSSYNELNSSAIEYISTLGSLTIRIKELVYTIGNDYKQKIEELEKERKDIVKSANSASEKLSEASTSFQNSLNKIEKRLKYSMYFNIIIIALATIIFWLVK